MLEKGNSELLNDTKTCAELSNMAVNLINCPNWNNDMIHMADLILRISNIAYNNTSNIVLPLDDGIYDQLAVMYYKYDPNYQVGAHPIIFEEQPQNEIVTEKVMCTYVDDMDKKLFMRDIWKQNVPLREMRPVNMCFIVRDPITKRLINTEHKYPELVGTLDKCKFVLNNDAIAANVFDKPSVQIFERDFIHKCLNSGIIMPNEEFEMVAELKYDGISVEAEVCGDTIITALSRGDTADNIATDLTPIFGGYKFPNAKNVPNDITFGMKFEAIITYYNLHRLGEARGKSYKNGRNAIIGLCGASDAYKYIDYITLIPLATSLDMNRISELNFLNKYYHSGEYNRYCVLRGDYQSILFQVKQFLESAEEIRKILPYMIDGAVISFTDKDKIAKLGRVNSVNKYSMAIKFNPRSARTLFLGYSYSVGKSGDIIPMCHFKPCEFIGGIHTKQTIHSYKRFKELNLAVGDEIDIDYVNDVITYITKPDTQHNRDQKEKPIEFITQCPCCGTELVISDSGKSAKCPNVNCYERSIMRMIDMIDRFGFKDFSEETVRALKLTSFNQLMNLTYEQVQFLGPINSSNLLNYINQLKNSEIVDYKLMSAFSFDGMADETWKLILKHYTLQEIINMILDCRDNEFIKINGIGPKTANAIIDGTMMYANDIEYCLNNFHIINSKGLSSGPKVAITGFRDSAFIKLLIDNGFDASDKYSVTKDTSALVADDINSTSSKVQKAKKYGIPIFNKSGFLEANNIILQ
jgi:DNA ligase (NAD+)